MSQGKQEQKVLKFTPIQSFIESSFFIKLSQLKLEKFKLDSSKHEIIATINHPNALNKFNDVPMLNLDQDSFEEQVKIEDNSGVFVKGEIYNVNTIEEFKSIDKLNQLTEWGNQIKESIKTATNFDHRIFNQFFILSFSDLKKYKFYYWVAYPTLNSKWVIKSVDVVSESVVEIIESETIRGYGQFFQIADGELFNYLAAEVDGQFVYLDTCLSKDFRPGSQLQNYLYWVAQKGFKTIELIIYRLDEMMSYKLELEDFDDEKLVITGWERTSQGKLGAKLADLGSLIDPHQLASQAVELNLKLMKWRIAPDINLEIIKQQKVLLLGAGTLGTYVARALLGWGVNNITLVDNGRVSYSNPVRQSLFQFQDCFSGDNGQGEWKALAAAKSLGEIFPGVNSQGINLEVPMIGHPITDETKQRNNFHKLCKLYDEHDVIFLLVDSREARWLPTVLGVAKNKIVINAALGFDSYLVMRHGNLLQQSRLGCYYCNDVVAPNDSLTDRTLDQMCTVTRPGAALVASALAVELLVALLQHPKKQLVEHVIDDNSKFGSVPHQIRGFLHNFQQQQNLYTPNYKYCSGCSDPVIEAFNKDGWEFIKQCLNDTGYLEEICGLTKVQQEAELATQALLEDLEIEDGEEGEDSEWLS
ncbi:Ubiquitin-like modifier-activating enzyme ATG7 [Spathaspora sp. JA1]|nr:Ubiquitin-like modifier-activating enzyme ATG7 [Spathaspora sp. JA1]